MSYFLKKTKKKKGTYLQIYEGHLSQERGHVVQSCYRSLGYLEELKGSGVADPIRDAQREVDELNSAAKEEKRRGKQIGIKTPLKHAGYFPIKNILEKLGVSVVMDMLQERRRFEFRVYDVFSALVFSRIIDPCSKLSTVNSIVPDLFNDYDFTYSQVLSCIEYMGNDYEKHVELLTRKVQACYGQNTSNAYFDCTNFYFEIDREDELRRKGPSKENRPNPLVSMGLLLDADMIPIGMKIFPGNKSEKPYLREIIGQMKNKGHVSGRTIQIADKGLNCAANIYDALSNKDGYIFSKSIKALPEVEKVWVFKDDDTWTPVMDNSGKAIYYHKECTDTFCYSFKDEDGNPVEFQTLEKRIVTYNVDLAAKQKAEIKKLADKAANCTYSAAKREEFGDAGKYIKFVAPGNSKSKVVAVFDEDAYLEDLKHAGLNMLVTSEVKMNARDVYRRYHELWRIEESFRIMKTNLDARPVFLQKKESIQGHFLICYAAVLLTRLLQIKELQDRYPVGNILRFIKCYQILKVKDSEYINVTQHTDFISEFAKVTGVPLANLYLTKKNLIKMGLIKEKHT